MGSTDDCAKIKCPHVALWMGAMASLQACEEMLVLCEMMMVIENNHSKFHHQQFKIPSHQWCCIGAIVTLQKPIQYPFYETLWYFAKWQHLFP
jgi:hypothetical protein